MAEGVPASVREAQEAAVAVACEYGPWLVHRGQGRGEKRGVDGASRLATF